MLQWFPDPALLVPVQLVVDDDGDAVIMTNPLLLRAMPDRQAADLVNRVLAMLPSSSGGVVATPTLRLVADCY